MAKTAVKMTYQCGHIVTLQLTIRGDMQAQGDFLRKGALTKPCPDCARGREPARAAGAREHWADRY